MMLFCKRLLSLLFLTALVLASATAGAADREPEPVVIVGSPDFEHAMDINNTLFHYPIKLVENGSNYYRYIVPEDSTYYFIFFASQVYFYDEKQTEFARNITTGHLSIFTLNLYANDTIYIRAHDRSDSSILTICNDNHHLSAEETVLTYPVTCCNDGQRANMCKYCNQLFDHESVPALGHTVGDWGYFPAATCTEPGAFGQLCETCGEVVNGIEMPALGHVPGEPTVVLEPNERQPGLMVVVCTECATTMETTVLPILTE